MQGPVVVGMNCPIASMPRGRKGEVRMRRVGVCVGGRLNIEHLKLSGIKTCRVYLRLK
jgi:hypothetical protein